MTKEKIREKYRLLLRDLDFDKLDLELKTPNIFEILGVSRTEIRHSNFLSWLLDPNGTHGLGKLFLIKFLRDLAISDKAQGLDELKIEELNFNNVELRREWKNIDLLIIFDTVVICIENKIDSKDHSEQLTRYREIINNAFKNRKSAFVYLTPTGEEPSSEKEIYAPYSYETIIDQIDRVLSIHVRSTNNNVYQYIFDYLAIIKREIMKNDTSNELANQLYKNHRELFDFVFEHKTDILSELFPVFENKVEDSQWKVISRNKGYARFLPPELYEIIPRKGTSRFKECFMFEIDFHLFPKAVFKTIIPDGTPPDIKEYLNALLESIEGSKPPIGKRWLTHFSHNWKFPKDMTEVDEAQILTILGEHWGEISEIVKKVECKLLENRIELQKYSM